MFGCGGGGGGGGGRVELVMVAFGDVYGRETWFYLRYKLRLWSLSHLSYTPPTFFPYPLSDNTRPSENKRIQ